MNTQENRTESSNPIQFARAAAVFLVLVVMGYAVSTQVESAMDTTKPAATVAAQQDPAPTVYFPAQYVNQAKDVEEHIQAF